MSPISLNSKSKGVIPSSPEVHVRTMRSDIESMSGHTSGVAEVKMPSPNTDKKFNVPFVPEEKRQSHSWFQKNFRKIIIVSLVVLSILAGILLYTIILPALSGKEI